MRAIVVTVYIGALPVWMPLWLRSCAANTGLDWLLVTDQPEPDDLPANVSVLTMSLDAVAAAFSAEVSFSVLLDRPYKLCDFKPLYHALVADLHRYDYWGFCDTDVIFGRVDAFFAEAMERYEKILSEGHLMLFRNDAESNHFYRQVDDPDWKRTLTTAPIGGLDEHHGINRVWARSGRAQFADPARVADLDPSFRQMRLLPQYRNYRTQAFIYENGRVFREYWARGRYGRDEFLYAHFQKRKLANAVGADDASFFITPTGFLPRAPGRTDRAAMRRVNPWRWPTRAEVMRVVRMRARMMLRGDDLYSSIRGGGGTARAGVSS